MPSKQKSHPIDGVGTTFFAPMWLMMDRGQNTLRCEEDDEKTLRQIQYKSA
jgi:hypothetical protein